jgi:molybdopterin converting factor subunit 1
MDFKVIYFASARDAAGRREERVSVAGAPTLEALADKIQRLHPGLAGIQKSTRYAVNLEIVNGDTVLHDGDEVGVLPAVTGG